ncbi:MAG: metal-dependent hydrolase, partial [Hydrogenophaga sp.]|nr:metal-dependent hydrolase [Hydrogenophaga sp.]
RQTANNLRRDGTLWRWSTWRSAARHMLGREGLLRRCFKPWRAYFRRDFHPSQQSSDLSQNWLRDNSRLYTRVGAA